MPSLQPGRWTPGVLQPPQVDPGRSPDASAGTDGLGGGSRPGWGPRRWGSPTPGSVSWYMPTGSGSLPPTRSPQQRCWRRSRTHLARGPAVAGPDDPDRAGHRWHRAALTVLFEFGLGHYVLRSLWSELLANYNLADGRIWVLVPVGGLRAGRAAPAPDQPELAVWPVRGYLTLAARRGPGSDGAAPDDTTVALTIPVGMRELVPPGSGRTPTDIQSALTALRLPWPRGGEPLVGLVTLDTLALPPRDQGRPVTEDDRPRPAIGRRPAAKHRGDPRDRRHEQRQPRRPPPADDVEDKLDPVLIADRWSRTRRRPPGRRRCRAARSLQRSSLTGAGRCPEGQEPARAGRGARRCALGGPRSCPTVERARPRRAPGGRRRRRGRRGSGCR